MPQHSCHGCHGSGLKPGWVWIGGVNIRERCYTCDGKKVCDCAAGPDPCTVCDKHCGGHCRDKQIEQWKKEEEAAKKEAEEKEAQWREDEELRNLAHQNPLEEHFHRNRN